MSIKVYPQGTLERKRLGDFCTVLHDITGGKFEVQDIYFDLGQDWWWTTIVCKDQNYQILNPHQHGAITRGYEDECLDEEGRVAAADQACAQALCHGYSPPWTLRSATFPAYAS